MKIDDFNISKVTSKDLTALYNISRQTFIETFNNANKPENMEIYLHENLSKQQLKQELAHPCSRFYFAKNSQHIIGYLKLNFEDAQTEFKLTHAIEIERIYVCKSHQRAKVGQRLLEFAFNEARLVNSEMIWLGVWEKNESAIAFYKQNGFQVFDKHQFILGTDVQTDVLMKRSLIF